MEKQTKTKTESTEYAASMAFIDWLHGKRSFVLIVQGEDGEENLCCVDGDIKSLTNTIANGMLQHDVLKRMLMTASTAVLNKRMKDMGLSDLFDTPDV